MISRYRLDIYARHMALKSEEGVNLNILMQIHKKRTFLSLFCFNLLNLLITSLKTSSYKLKNLWRLLVIYTKLKSLIRKSDKLSCAIILPGYSFSL